MPEVHVLVTCTKRKTRPPAPALQLSTVEGETTEERAGVWLERLRGARAEVPVAELYAGDHWSVARSLAGATTSGGLRIRVWVCSAGYGLLAWDSRIAPYAATFAPGQPDSVARSGGARSVESVNRTWWGLLVGGDGPAPGRLRSIADLVGAFPRSYFLLAVSPPYLAAVGADLRRAVERLPDPDRLAVLSAGSGGRGELAEYLVPCSARLQSLVGGARASLNIRLARLALRESGAGVPRLSTLQILFRRLLREQPRRPAPRRSPLTDEQVRAYIRETLRRDRRQRPTPLLARLRSQSRACEQSRFVSLFRQVEEELHGT